MGRKKSALRKPADSLISLKAELESMDHLEFPTLSSCIYRVPPQLRNMNKKAYTPTLVSIGPYHHGNKRLKSMEEVKLWFLYKFLKRINQEKLLDDYVKVLKDQEGKIRRCYSETIQMESDEFVRMILTDACFIIEYFLLRLDSVPWHSKLWSLTIKLDLILLENQLPFFVLQDLFGLTFPNGYHRNHSFESVTFCYFHSAFLRTIFANRELRSKFTFSYFVQHHLPRQPDGTVQVHHLCDMLRVFYVRLDQIPRELDSRSMKPVYSASKLHDAGIKFEVNEDELSLLDLKHPKGVLKIPRIVVNDGTETMLRNVVAFEQCHLPSSRSMTDYIILLEHLIET
ncbi:UPF0481 protein At3g47200-like [Prosopis cineraria]|uniref:UPF0481 protein At3g47200-like n=1 Tax=Prosopis cineraria TaxID=364024 RepID=UPI002410564C|nr:UPF0481 protein At3g47200-like [Prosopis cineraria]XP_054782532.1 UPF0481 protein At3g47200-like [Prosopis cineraria]XP_054782533.1 UPF0481 protein At3g47200-like [Prosopis cineraria]XP_054782534.1 UPF0481 protein At3g47200-like [Prosopis cineraria]